MTQPENKAPEGADAYMKANVRLGRRLRRMEWRTQDEICKHSTTTQTGKQIMKEESTGQISSVVKEAVKLAMEKFPYVENPNDDLGIREWNQRMYDKREAFVDGYIVAWKPS